jgi:hypothetical protein
MQGYVNKKTLVENEISKMFSSSTLCPLCESILIKPVMCMNCQNNYCKDCIEKWKEKNNKCPKGCESPNYQKSIGKNDILSKLKFRCVGCGNEIPYDEAEKHHGSCCPDKTISDMKQPIKTEEAKPEIPRKTKLKKLTPEESEKLVKKGKEMVYITSK